MKKEVYTRKPKQAYERLKRILGSDAKYANRKGSRVDIIPHNWNALRKKRSRLIVLSIVLIVFAGLILWEPLINWQFHRKRRQFEQIDLSKTIVSSKQREVRLLEFMGKRTDKIFSIDREVFSSHVQIVLFDSRSTSEELSSYSFHWQGGQPNFKHSDEILGNGSLVLHRNETTDTINRNWSYFINGIPIHELSSSIVEYMNTSHQELHDLLLSSPGEIYVQRSTNGLAYVPFHLPGFGHYQLVYSSEELSDTVILRKDSLRELVFTGKVENNIYWKRIETIKN